MMKKAISALMTLLAAAMIFTACDSKEPVKIVLSDEGITVDGSPASENPGSAVYISKDIVFYLEGQGEKYGEGTAEEEHSQSQADMHTVINITRPGDYVVSGSISHGQIAVNLGEDGDENEENIVNLTLNNADITCTVAPAIICYSAYECSSGKSEDASKDTDLSKAGFNIYLADGSENNIDGSHVAKILDPETGKKLHKYDAAIESLVSFTINGSDGVLNLKSDNEGIETKLHLTINGGEININSCDDAINAGEDGISVITINDGKILADATNGDEGDGIDSNGWLVINGGSVTAFGCDKSTDSGLDSDKGVYINGGTVFATGNMYDRISPESTQQSAVFKFDWWIYEEEYVLIKSSGGDRIAGFKSNADYKVLIYSSPLMTNDDCTLYKAESITGESVNGVYVNITEAGGEIQLAHRSSSGSARRPGGDAQKPDGDLPGGKEHEDKEERASGGTPPKAPDRPSGDEKGESAAMPGGKEPEQTAVSYGLSFVPQSALSPVFTFSGGLNIFNAVQEYNP